MLTTPRTLPDLSPTAAIELLEGLARDHRPTSSLPRRIPASEIELLSVFNSRASRDDDAVAELLAALIAGDTLPPLVVYVAGQRVFLIDGHMRLAAHRLRAREKGREDSFTVPVHAFEGTPAQAVITSIERNAKHGVKLTSAERSDAAWKLVVIDRGLTRTQIAGATGISRRTINTMRNVCRKLGTEAARYGSWLEVRLALSRQVDLSVEEMLDLRDARGERMADQLAHTLGAGHSADPDLMARAMWHYMGRNRGEFARAVAEHFCEASDDEGGDGEF